ncbi:MAG: DUF3237 domain-containing protein [Candidatus Abyssobacteria bacterium SURF_5]|uniref:UPF0311 protein C4520_02945 n=1 Tax=Abyssobacteria bacterium (strain SURF_5) TaxID=2093360 RepID=A0A3A4P1S2_ABYX5|nr:MAG: DUF3237 domain-containing protein [Candidatus Abyssubacteria bacterium SURF_5]
MPAYQFDTEYLFDIEAELSLPELIGQVPEGLRIHFYIQGGKFEGPKLRGTLKPVGADWFVIRPDGIGQLDVRATLETDDGAAIYVYYKGLIDFPEDVKKELAQGGLPQGGEFRILTNPTFRTSSPKYSWLNGTFAVGVGSSGENKVKYSIYKIK